MSLQQNQTLDYFRSHASDWQAKATTTNTYPLITARHKAVHHARLQNGAKSILDIGCGTGQLAIECAQDGLRAVGVDFAAEMIAQCEKNNDDAGASATFMTASAFELPDDIGTFDLISAQGLIEYISLEQLEQFWLVCARLLNPGGIAAIGSRNRLFNAVSLNAFTELEASTGELEQLTKEAIAVQGASSQKEMFESLHAFGRPAEQPAEHPLVDITVNTRNQFSPGDLSWRMRNAGFVPEQIYPVHFHGLPTAMVEKNPELHWRIATAVEEIEYPNHRIAPRCSSYVLAARKN